ncbi:unnamed protein product, partial [Vitis vinifera]
MKRKGGLLIFLLERESTGKTERDGGRKPLCEKKTCVRRRRRTKVQARAPSPNNPPIGERKPSTADLSDMWTSIMAPTAGLLPPETSSLCDPKIILPESRNLPPAFIFAVNIQVPGREHHSAVFYFATEDPIPPGSLFYRFIHGDDAFRNQRFKIVNRIVKGPWIVKAAVGNYAACLLGKALTCSYHRGSNYLEIDVDIGSSAIANAILRLALGYVTAVNIDMGFLVEAQAEEELPEKLLGAVRVCQMEMSSATFVEASPSPENATGPVAAVSKRGLGLSKVNHHKSEDDEDGNF